jgi:hypothetical protein
MEFEGKTVHDVLQEVIAGKRKAVIYPGELEAEGFRANVVFENWPWHYPMGALENPGFQEAPPIYLSRRFQEADRQATEFTARLGISPEERLLIIASSMRAQDLLRSVKVKRDPDTDEATLYTGDGTELVILDAKDAARLYQQLAEGYGWAYSELCPECQVELENGECPNCGWDKED